MNTKNVFGGTRSFEDLLHPRNTAPLVELPPELNPFHRDGVEIWAKVYGNNNIKAVTAFGMLQEARESGKLDGKHTFVESSSGNLVVEMFHWMPYFGLKKGIAVIPRELAGGKLDLIRLCGLDIVIHAGDGIALADTLAEQDGHVHLNQYRNLANPATHKSWTGPQILGQTFRRVRILASSLGSTGTIVGSAQFLRDELGPKGITTVAAVCAPGSMVPGARSLEGLKQIGFDWKPWCDHIREVTTEDAFRTSWAAFIRGIHAGPSSGLALKGLLDFLRDEKEAGRFEMYRGPKDGKIVAVAIFPDSQEKYLEKYVTHLHPEDWL